jgi:hypothetical protein
LFFNRGSYFFHLEEHDNAVFHERP